MGKKRKKTEGSVGTHKSGSVHVRVYVPVKLRHLYNGQRRVSVYGRTEEEAFAKRDALKQDMDRRKYRAGSQTFGAYLLTWLDNLGALQLVGERTLQDHRYASEKHLIPRLGTVILEDLTAEDLDDLYTRLRREGVGVRTVNHVHSTARVALQRAVKKRLVPHNPARDADPPPYSTDGREYAVLSEEDVPRFFEAASGDRFEALFVLSVLTGVRPAEARALRWPDVDLDRGELTVRRSVVELDGRPPKIVDKTKTRRSRVVPLPPPVVSALRSHKARQNGERLALNGLWEDDTIVFPNSRGGHGGAQPLPPAPQTHPARGGPLREDPRLRPPALLRHAVEAPGGDDRGPLQAHRPREDVHHERLLRAPRRPRKARRDGPFRGPPGV